MANQWAMDRAFYDIFERDQRIAALEAQIARLTAPVTEEEADQAISDYYSMVNNMRPGSDMQIAITAFLERRINGC